MIGFAKHHVLAVILVLTCELVELPFSQEFPGDELLMSDDGIATGNIYLFEPTNLYMRDEYITLASEAEAVIGVDDFVIIKCRFGGFQPPSRGGQYWSISWTRHGGDFSLLTNFGGQIFSKSEDEKYSFVNMSDGSGECSMKIDPVTRDDEGLYEIEVSYNVPLKKQIYLYLTEPAGPTGVVVNSTGTKVVQGEPNVILNCYVFGAHPKTKTVRWSRDGKPLNVSVMTESEKNRYKFGMVERGRFHEHFIMNLFNVQLRDSGEYGCEAGNEFGKVKGSIKLNVRSKPNIAFNVVPSKFARVGERRVLQCSDTYQAYPEPTMQIEQQWDSKMLSRSRGHLTAFVVQSVEAGHAGAYICKAENEEGKVMQTAQLFVQYLDMYLLVPAIGQPNGSLLVAQDDLLFVNCIVKSSPRADIVWIRSDAPDAVLSEASGVSELALKIQPVTKKHVGVYKCVASVKYYDDSEETQSREVSISVIRAARILRIEPEPNEEGVITFNQDETARVHCVFSDGFPPSKAQWTLRGDPVSTVTRTTTQSDKSYPGETVHTLTLVLQKLRPEDSAKYICGVSNSDTPGSFRQIEIAVKTLPKVVLNIVPLPVAVQGENRSVQCVDSAQSYPPPQMYLSHSGELGTVLKSSNHSLHFPLNNIQPQVAGVWTCGAKNEVGSSVQVNVTVIVHYKPEVEIMATRSELKEGETFTAKCISRANPAALLKWIHLNSGVILREFKSKSWQGTSKVSSADDSSSITSLDLIIPNITPAKSGTLACQADNEMYNGQRLVTTKYLNLTVLSPPKNLSLYPRVNRLTVAERDDVLLKCIYDEGLPSSDHQWTFRPQGATDAKRDVVMTSSSTSTSQGTAFLRLDIKNITKHQSGLYTCSTWSALFPARDNRSISVDVIYPPLQPHIQLISKLPLDYPASVLKAFCSANQSNPVAVIHWFLDGDLLGVDSFTTILSNQSGQLSQSFLEMAALRSMDGKRLWCEASNAQFPSAHTASNKIYLEVLFPPEIKYTKSAYPMAGESATIECLAHGNPTPSIDWFYGSDRRPVNSSDNVRVIVEVNSNRKKTLGKLAVREINANVLGSYRCEAFSSLAPNSKVVEIVNITEAVRPSSPTMRSVQENVGMHSVNVSWDPPKDGSHLKNCWFQVGYQTEYRSFSERGSSEDDTVVVTSVIEEKIPSSLFFYTVKGLVPGRKYTFIVRTCNKVGCSNSDFRTVQLSYVNKVPSQLASESLSSAEENPSDKGLIGHLDGPQMTILEIILLLVIGCFAIALLYLLAMLMLSIRKIKVLQDKTKILDAPSFATLPNDFVVGSNCSQMMTGRVAFANHGQRGQLSSTGLRDSYRDSSRI